MPSSRPSSSSPHLAQFRQVVKELRQEWEREREMARLAADKEDVVARETSSLAAVEAATIFAANVRREARAEGGAALLARFAK